MNFEHLGYARIRQTDVGWEYNAGHGWRKANNREQAVEFAKQDSDSGGQTHAWRIDYDLPHKIVPQMARVPQMRESLKWEPKLLKLPSFFAHLAGCWKRVFKPKP